MAYRPTVKVRIPDDINPAEHAGIRDIADEINKRLKGVSFDGRGGKQNAIERACFAIHASRCTACLIAEAERCV